jgi:hypothetical protein
VIRRYGGAVLVFEALVIVLAVPVAINVAGARAPVAIAAGLLLAVGAIVLAARLDRPWAVTAGWVLQGWVLLTAFVVPVMGILGLIFTALWYAALRLAAADTGPADHGSSTSPAAGGPTTTEEA